MKIIRAEYMGWCFGVRDAVALVSQQAQRWPVTIVGELVHNAAVNAGLAARGVRFVQDASQIATATAIVTAHGASATGRQRIHERAATVVDATCPLVQAAHHAVQRLVAAGFYPVIIGQREHVEVRGLTGDLVEFAVMLTSADVSEVPARSRYGVVAQTTQPIERVRELAELIRQRFPDAEVRLVDTVCQPTKQRQHAAVELAQQCDALVVIGGPQSSNTRELVATCARYCPHVVRVESAGELERSWFAGVRTVGITAGTSTPDPTICEVEEWLATLAGETDAPTNHVRAAAVGSDR